MFFFELYIILRIYTSGKEVHDKKDGNPFVSYETDDYRKMLILVHFIGLYWLIIVLNNFNDFVCAAITTNYYFKTDIANMRILCHSLGHHIGSVAWSVILLPTLIVKIFFGWIDFFLTSDEPNGCQRCLNKFLCPCCWCYEKLIDRFSENYFPVTYMGSENFWTATTRFYYLSEKYANETYTVFLVGQFFGLVGKLLISFLTGYFGYVMYQNSMELQ